MAQQAIPEEFIHRNGRTVKLFVANNGDTVVRQFDGTTPKRYEGFSFQPHGIARYHELRRESGLACADYEAPSRPPAAKVAECAPEDHDWDWAEPDNDDSRATVCTKCGAVGEAEDE